MSGKQQPCHVQLGCVHKLPLQTCGKPTYISAFIISNLLNHQRCSALHQFLIVNRAFCPRLDTAQCLGISRSPPHQCIAGVCSRLYIARCSGDHVAGNCRVPAEVSGLLISSDTHSLPNAPQTKLQSAQHKSCPRHVLQAASNRRGQPSPVDDYCYYCCCCYHYY